MNLLAKLNLLAKNEENNIWKSYQLFTQPLPKIAGTMKTHLYGVCEDLLCLMWKK